MLHSAFAAPMCVAFARGESNGSGGGSGGGGGDRSLAAADANNIAAVRAAAGALPSEAAASPSGSRASVRDAAAFLLAPSQALPLLDRAAITATRLNVKGQPCASFAATGERAVGASASSEPQPPGALRPPHPVQRDFPAVLALSERYAILLVAPKTPDDNDGCDSAARRRIDSGGPDGGAIGSGRDSLNV